MRHILKRRNLFYALNRAQRAAIAQTGFEKKPLGSCCFAASFNGSNWALPIASTNPFEDLSCSGVYHHHSKHFGKLLRSFGASMSNMWDSRTLSRVWLLTGDGMLQNCQQGLIVHFGSIGTITFIRNHDTAMPTAQHRRLNHNNLNIKCGYDLSMTDRLSWLPVGHWGIMTGLRQLHPITFTL